MGEIAGASESKLRILETTEVLLRGVSTYVVSYGASRVYLGPARSSQVHFE
jgi:hypothetical protein